MPNTYIKIASATVGSTPTNSVIFSIIPSTYTDLLIKYSLRTNAAEVRSVPAIYFNGDGTAANYGYRRLYGIPSVATGSDTNTVAFIGYISGGNATASTFGNGEIYIPNYNSSNAKSFSNDGVGETNANEAGLSITANGWTGTAAINQINMTSTIGSFVQYSTITLYGISNA